MSSLEKSTNSNLNKSGNSQSSNISSDFLSSPSGVRNADETKKNDS